MFSLIAHTTCTAGRVAVVVVVFREKRERPEPRVWGVVAPDVVENDRWRRTVPDVTVVLLPAAATRLP